MGIYAIKPWFRGRLRGATGALVRRGVSPDAVTAAGVAASVLGGAAIAAGRWSRWVWLLVPVLAFLRIAANALDGLVAQESGRARPAGELFNETADRVGDAAFLCAIATLPGVPPALPLGALAVAFAASFVGVTAKAAGGTRRYDGPAGKPDRMAVVAAMALWAAVSGDTGIWRTGCMLLIGFGLATVANRYLRAYRELEGR